MGKQETLHLGSTGRALGTDRTYHPGGRPAQSLGSRKRSDPRQMLNGIIFRLVEPIELGDDSTIHRTFQRWVGTGVLHRWGALVEGCEELDGVDWQAADGAMGKRFDLIGPNPTDRGKAYQRSLLVDPLWLREQTCTMPSCGGDPDAIVVERPQPTEEEPQHLCLDKGYDNPSGRGAAAGHGYREHIRRIGEEKLDASGDKRYPARRWVVERTLAWLSKCRAVLVRYDKKAANYLGVLQLACALLWFRRQWRLAILR